MYSSQTLVSDGTVQRVDLSIEFLVREDIRVFVDDALLPANGYSWTWVSDTAITLNQPVHNRGVINIRRTTAYDNIKHVFEVGGAVFKDRNVDENFRQVLYWCQDFIEGKSIEDVWNNLNMHGFRITNIGTAIDSYDAVSLGQYQADAMGAWQASRIAQQTNAQSIEKLNTVEGYSTAMRTVMESDDITLDVPFPDGSFIPTVAKRTVGLTSAVTSVNGEIGDVKVKGVIITCTSLGFSTDPTVDNTPMLAALLNTAMAKDVAVYVDGIFYFKSGNLDVNLNKHSIVFYGDNEATSAFLYERASGNKTSYVDDDFANKIATIRNAGTIAFQRVAIKGITSLANPNGAATNTDAVYHGDVFGFVLDSFEHLIVDAEVAGFNYRGISVKCSGSYGRTQNGRVSVLGGEYHHNKGSGLWIRYTDTVEVFGGSFHHNGLLGQMGTGYGITASLAVNRCIVHAGHFYRNFRKGFDTHGCLNVTINGGVFEDNALWHIALMQWGTTAANSLFVSDEYVDIDNCTFTRGATVNSRAWLNTHYTAIVANGFKPLVQDINVDAVLSDGTTFGTTLRSVHIGAGNKFLCNYYGGLILKDKVTSTTQFRFAAQGADVILDGTIRNAKFNAALGASMYIACPVFVTAKSFKLKATMDYTGSNFNYGVYYGALVLLQDEQTLDFQTIGADITVPKAWFISAYSGVNAEFPAFHKIGPSGKCITLNSKLNFAGSPTADVQSYAFFGHIFNNAYPEHYQINNTIIVGGTTLPRLTSKSGCTHTELPWRVGSALGTIAAGTSVFEVITDTTSLYDLELRIYTQVHEIFRVSQYGYTYPTNITSTPSTNFSYASTSEFTDTDGIKKRRYAFRLLKALTVPTYIFGTVRMTGALGSYGIYSINQLI